MKKILSLLLFAYTSLSFGQAIDYDNVKWTVKDSSGFNVNYIRSSDIQVSDSIISFTISPRSYKSIWDCKIQNIGADKINIKWKDAAMGSSNPSRILFGDLRMFEINKELPDAVIYRGSFIEKEIGGEYYIGKEYTPNMIPLKEMKKDFKKTGSVQNCNVTIIIPIEYNGMLKTCKFVFIGEYAGKIKSK